MKSIYPWLVFTLLCKSILSQESHQEIIQEVLERRIESSTQFEESDFIGLDEFERRLARYLNRKIFLNLNGIEEVEQLQILEKADLSSIEKHVKNYGSIVRPEELYMIEGLDHEIIDLLSNFIKYENEYLPEERNEIDRKTSLKVRMRTGRLVQKSRGFEEQVFNGNIWNQNLLIKLDHLRWLDAGLNIEKDAGERLKIGNNSQVDHAVAYLRIRTNSIIKSLIIGDYVVGFGQGLTYSMGMSNRKSEYVLTVQPNTIHSRPFTSNNEFYYLRGICSEIEFGHFKFVPFYSHRKLSANNVDSDLSSFTSFYSSGLHRSDQEISKKKAIRLKTFGASIERDLKNFTFGIIGIKERLSHVLSPPLHFNNQNEKPQLFRIKKGAFFRQEGVNYSAFGETNFDKNRISWLIGSVIMPHSTIALSALIRKYEATPTSISRSSFGESSTNRNELGFYQSMRIKIHSSFKISAFVDFSENIIPGETNTTKLTTKDYLLSLAHKKKKEEFSARIRWKEQDKEIGQQSQKLSKAMAQIRKNLRLQYISHSHENWRFRSRAEFSEYTLSDTAHQGALFFQEVKFKKIQFPLSFLIRFTLFNTENYNSRIYAYEQDLEGIYNISPFYGKGSRIMFLFNYKMTRFAKLSFKISHTEYDDRSSIGSGLDEVKSSEKTYYRMQLLIKI